MTTHPAEVQAQLERILASPIFSASARSVQFLRFCVEQSLQGNHDQIKESTVAVQVFGRTPSYDPRTDPIVRVHAKRLREKLDHYYTVLGADDPIRITIPKGGYIPHAVRTLPRTKLDFSDWPSDTATEVTTKPAAAKTITKRPHLSRRALWWMGIATAGLLLCIVVAALVRPRAVSSSALRVEGEPLPLNAFPGRERNPSWSPDGKLLAFSWDGGLSASPKIYLQKTEQSQPYRLTRNSQPEYRPVWSPGGKEIAFIRYVDSGHFEVIRASLSDSSEKSVGVFSYNWPLPDDQPALDWSPDAKSLLVAEQPSGASPVRLMLFDLATGKRKPLTEPPTGTSGDIEGKFSSDGSLVAFRRGGLGDLYVVSVAGETNSPARRLTPDNPGVRGIAWSKDGKHILFGSMEGGLGWGIWQVSLNGGQLTPVLTGSFNAISPAISSDGRRLAAEQDDLVTNLMELPLGREGTPRLLAPSSRQDYTPVYSPDGKKLVFTSTRSGSMELWLANSDGGNVQQFTRFNGKGFPLTPSWSPDGEKIIFAIRRNGATNLAVGTLQGGAIRQLTSTLNRDFNPVYSADGQFIYFHSNDGGVGQIWRMPANEKGKPEQTFWDVSGMFQLSAADQSIFFKDSEEGLGIARRNLATGSLQSVFHSKKRLSAPEALCVHAKTLYLVLSSVAEPSRSDLVAVDIPSGNMQVLKRFDLAMPGMESGCTVSPDGRTLVLTTVQRDDNDIYLANLAGQ